MNTGDLGLVYPFLAGITAFFNPCGFALLPSYISYYLAQQETPRRKGWSSSWHGLTLGATVSAGFFTVFGGLGLLISAIGIATANKTLMPASPWTAAGLGALVVFLGFLTLFKQDFSLAAPFERLAAQLQRSQAAGESLVFYYFYGLGYAIASCGCTLPVFVTVFTWALSRGLTDGLLVFSAYAWGMTSMMLLLSLLTVYAKELLHRYVRVLVPWIQRLAGIIMIVAGSYLIYDQLIVSQIIRF